MAYAEKRDEKLTGFWYGEVMVKTTGVRFRRRFDTKRKALGYEAHVRAAGCEPDNLLDAKNAGPTFSTWLAQLRATKAGERIRDRSGARRLDFLAARIGHLTIPQITTTVLDSLVADLTKRPSQVGGGKLTSGTINRYLAGVSSVIKFAREHQARDAAPLVAPVIPWRDDKGKRIHWLSEAQEAVLVPYMLAQGWHAEALTLRVLCATGLRWSEFSSLEAHQCQPEWILLTDTKTDTPRDVPIDEALARELKAMVVTGTTPKYEPTRIRLKAAVKACGFSDKLGLHNARHGTATRLIKAGVPLPVVQRFLGHGAIATTMKYVHVENDDLHAAMKKLSPRRGFLTENEPHGELIPFKKQGA